MRRVMEIVRTTAITRKLRPLVVLSAAAGVTNALIRIGELSLKEDTKQAIEEIEALEARHIAIATGLKLPVQSLKLVSASLKSIFDDLRRLVRGVHLLRELTPKSKDQFQSAGERCSTLIFAAAFREMLRKEKVEVELVDSREFFRTNNEHTHARPQPAEIRRLMRKVEQRLTKGQACIAQGFIGSTSDGVTTTIGRGGSDFSAAIMGVAVQAKEIQIWTDVAGILTCDPRIAPKAYTIPQITFDDASALAFFGAKVLHPETIWPAVQKGIPVLVLSSKEPEKPGTRILASLQEPLPIAGLALKTGVTLAKITSRSALPEPRIQLAAWDALTNAAVVPLAVSLSADSAMYVVDDPQPLHDLRSQMEEYASIEFVGDHALLTLVGEGLQTQSGIAARIFKSLGRANCEMISYGGSSSSISLVIEERNAKEAAKRLHAEFFE